MIVCSCNVIMRKDIEEVITGLLVEDAWQLITPGVVYHAMKKRGRCCGCFPNVISIIVDVTERYHREIETPDDKIIPFIQKIRAEHERCETARMIARQARLRRTAA
ncbi:(2Fe-2S)-binding protein [Oricola sp.]|uniref:(2Fe-2S)-binding protein n=1 Tax=Oricola sp. TaxID=1979950 RepID=UPI0025E8DB8A|nr:(2Fe-2S)-binding protein [Oricola sp.]MCI5078550.1 (2Fe-2S)-binding protein [Oricola sp.]